MSEDATVASTVDKDQEECQEARVGGRQPGHDSVQRLKGSGKPERDRRKAALQLFENEEQPSILLRE